MYTNTDCTVYSKHEEGYAAVYIPACCWEEIKAHEVKKYGAELADDIKVIIPLSSLTGYKTEWDIPEGSYIAKGSPDIDVTDSIEPLISSNGDVYSVSSVTDNLRGSEAVRHITVYGR
ncbi:MAG: hypothetical protein IJ446_08950 [Oscillospiraceae bacterium]|nr:hypothetical protein [Oscillospiraceae bacterium]